MRLNDTTRLALHLRDAFQCLLCRAPLRTVKARSIAVNWYRPACHGGSSQPRNLYTACKACSRRRRGALWFRMVAPHVAPLAPYVRAASTLLDGRTFAQALYAAQRMPRKGAK